MDADPAFSRTRYTYKIETETQIYRATGDQEMPDGTMRFRVSSGSILCPAGKKEIRLRIDGVEAKAPKRPKQDQ